MAVKKNVIKTGDISLSWIQNKSDAAKVVSVNNNLFKSTGPYIVLSQIIHVYCLIW